MPTHVGSTDAKKIFLITFPCFFLSRLLTEEHIPNKNRSLAGFGAGRMPETLVKKTFSGLWQLCFTQRKPPRNRNPKLFRKMWFRLKQQLMLRFELIFKFTPELTLSKRRLYLLIWDPKNSSQWVCPSERAHLSAKETTESYELNLGGCIAQRKLSCFPPSSPGFNSRHRRDFSLNCFVCEQYWDWTHLVLSNGFHKYS